MSKIKAINKTSVEIKANPMGNNDLNEQLELELCWCIQQLEIDLNSGSLRNRVAEDTAKNIKILKNKNVPLIKKRQIMKASLGDYRQKMKDDEKKMSLLVKQIKFTTPPLKKENNGSISYIKKSAVISSKKDLRCSFKTENQTVEANDHLQRITENDKMLHSNISSDSNFKFNFIVSDNINDQINFDTIKM